MCAAREQNDIIAEDRKHARKQRSGEAAADDRNLKRLLHAPPHASQAIRGSAWPLKFMRCRRSIRSDLQSSQAARRSTSHKSAVTTASEKRKHCSSDSSSCDSVGGVK